MKFSHFRRFALAILFPLLIGSALFAQSNVFTYQGSLKDGANPANGNFDFDVKLYTAASGGLPITAQGNLNIPVTNGIFTITLGYGAAFTGGDRWIEIHVRPSGGQGTYTVLEPRQRVLSSPYSIRSLNSDSADSSTNALQLGGLVASQYVLTGDARMSDARNPLPGSASYIQNNISPQASSNFNISGTGRANILSATTQYNIGLDRVLAMPGSNTFVGLLTGVNTTGAGNSFFGSVAGRMTTTGTGNAFFGSSPACQTRPAQAMRFSVPARVRLTLQARIRSSATRAGSSNTTGGANAFFGYNAGGFNTTTSNNSFFGYVAGKDNSTGASNAFFGSSAGSHNSSGSNNAFFGARAGEQNTLGFNNAFFGDASGQSNLGGSDNAFFGVVAGNKNSGGLRNSFFGGGAGLNNLNANDNSFFGNGAGFANQNGAENSFFGRSAGGGNTGNQNSFFGAGAGEFNAQGTLNAFFGYRAGRNNGAGLANSYFGNFAGESGSGVSNIMIGQEAGRLASGDNNVLVGARAGYSTGSGSDNNYVGFFAGQVSPGSNNTLLGANASAAANLTFATAIGAGASVSGSNTVVLGRSNDFVVIPGLLTVPNLAAAGTTQLCRNNFDRVGTCSSSLRYKTNVVPFASGLDLVRRLRPISFTWKDGGMNDLGLGAEDVAKIEPLLVTYDKDGQVEGVKYDRIGVILLNVVKEQQAADRIANGDRLRAKTVGRSLQKILT